MRNAIKQQVAFPLPALPGSQIISHSPVYCSFLYPWFMLISLPSSHALTMGLPGAKYHPMLGATWPMTASRRWQTSASLSEGGGVCLSSLTMEFPPPSEHPFRSCYLCCPGSFTMQSMWASSHTCYQSPEHHCIHGSHIPQPFSWMSSQSSHWVQPKRLVKPPSSPRDGWAKIQ